MTMLSLAAATRDEQHWPTCSCLALHAWQTFTLYEIPCSYI